MVDTGSRSENIPIDFYTDNRILKWRIDATRIEEWFVTLDKETRQLVSAALEVLASRGPSLRRPLVGEVKGSRFKNMKELRPGSSGDSEIRILFAFDPERRAIMLFAGDKQRWWNRWYRRAIPKADRLYQEHLDSLRKKGAGNGDS